MAGERRGGRERGKSDLIDAVAVARAALREGVERLPVAELAGVELDIRLLVDHRERLVRMRSAPKQRPALAAARPLARADAAGQRALVEQVGHPHGAAPGAPRTERPGPDRPRRTAPDARALAHHRRARGRDRRARREGRAPAARRARLRPANGRQADRRDRRRPALLKRRQARPRRRHRTDPRQLRQDQPPPPRPRRQPPDQHRNPPRRSHPRTLPPGDARLHRTQALRRQDQPRRHPLPQTPPRSSRLAPAPTTGAPPIAINHLTKEQRKQVPRPRVPSLALRPWTRTPTSAWSSCGWPTSTAPGASTPRWSASTCTARIRSRWASAGARCSSCARPNRALPRRPTPPGYFTSRSCTRAGPSSPRRCAGWPSAASGSTARPTTP